MLLALSICFCYKLIGLISVPTKMNGWSSEQDREEREERGKIKCYWGFFFPHVGFNCDWCRHLKKIKCFIIIFYCQISVVDDLGTAGTPESLSTGSAGGRLACGVVSLSSSSSSSSGEWELTLLYIVILAVVVALLVLLILCLVCYCCCCRKG